MSQGSPIPTWGFTIILSKHIRGATVVSRNPLCNNVIHPHRQDSRELRKYRTMTRVDVVGNIGAYLWSPEYTDVELSVSRWTPKTALCATQTNFVKLCSSHPQRGELTPSAVKQQWISPSSNQPLLLQHIFKKSPPRCTCLITSTLQNTEVPSYPDMTGMYFWQNTSGTQRTTDNHRLKRITFSTYQ
jgi:hypothetical protein